MSESSAMGMPAPRAASITSDERKVLTATLVGTAIEWYDYFIYAQMAGLVLGALFFGPLAQNNPAMAQIISFATIGISFLFRPLGAIVCGSLGDRLGRKMVLVMTLVLTLGFQRLVHPASALGEGGDADMAQPQESGHVEATLRIPGTLRHHTDMWVLAQAFPMATRRHLIDLA